MRYLPLELELTILELAAPPLAIDRLHERVAFFINISLVHRSLTAWAQERLCDQFLYTYRRRSDEHERLKMRFEAGSVCDQPVRRLYLDFSHLPSDIPERREPGTDSVSADINGRFYAASTPTSRAVDTEEGGLRSQEKECEAVAHYSGSAADEGGWSVCPMIKTYSQRLDMLWLKVPLAKLDVADLPAPHALCIDDHASCCFSFKFRWGYFETLPLSSNTVLFLRYIRLPMDRDVNDLDPLHLIFDKCWLEAAAATELLGRFHHLETLVLFETEVDNFVQTLLALPTTIRRVHSLQQDVHFNTYSYGASVVLPGLESFTFTWLLPPTDSGPQILAGDDLDALADLQQAVESIVDAPQCTFKYLRFVKSPEDAFADALAAFKLDL